MHLAYKAAQVIKDQLTPDLLLSLIILKLVTNKGSYSMNTASAKSKSLLQFSEIDELKRMTDTHSIAEAKYISLVEQIPVITYIASLETPVKLLYVSQQISQLGFPAADWLDDPQGLLKRVHPEDVAVTIEAYALTYEHHVPLRCEYRLNNHDGQSRWFLNKANVVLNEAGESLFLQGVLVDITKNKETEQELSYYRRRLEELVSQRTEQLEKQCMILKSANANLDAALIELKQANSDARKSMTAPHAKIQSLAYQASHDPLTGLINRRAFEKRIARVLTSAQPNYFQHALCYLNLDHFKHINDNFGHAAGDELLQKISTLLTTKLRQRDNLARIGGDEFALLLEHTTLDQARNIADSLCESLRNFSFTWEGTVCSVSASIGLTVLTCAVQNVGELLKNADTACYRAKKKGRNQVQIFIPNHVASMDKVALFDPSEFFENEICIQSP